MAMASAAPSVGSVPAPSSSNKTRERSFTFSRKETILVMCEEKVLKDCSMLCSSPISAYTSSNTASSERSRAGMCSPACPIKVNSPVVFKETVFPPVFGPVTMSKSKVSPRRMVVGTTVFGSSNG